MMISPRPETPRSTHHSTRAVPAFVLAFALISVFAPATRVQAQDLPEADALIQRYVERIGGASMWAESGTITRGTFSIVGMGLDGDFVQVMRPPNQQRMDITLPGIGVLQQGFDGEVGWSVNPMAGAQITTGAELEQAREQTSLAASLRDPSLIPGRETLSRVEIDGEACWRVRLTWASGNVSYDCYAVESGLLLATDVTQSSPLGEIEARTVYKDYREFEGRLLPSRLVQSSAGQTVELRIREVTFEEVSPEQVAPPQVIRTLRGGGDR
jgi:hypothetical protein